MDKIEIYRPLSLKYEGKFLVYGIIIGSILSMLWTYVFYPLDYERLKYFPMQTVSKETEKQLLNYINGKWVSSIGDVIIKADIVKDKDFIILSIINDEKEERKYKIQNINKVNGFLGVVKLDICLEQTNCNQEDLIPIQFNKVFGIKKTIAISYDSRLTYCIEDDDNCTRAFKRVE